MNVKGLNMLEKHFPDLHTSRGRLFISLYAVFWFALVTAYFLVSDNIPTWSIDSQILIMALGLLLFSLFFSRRKLYQEKYGDLAYRNAAVRLGIPGLGFISAALVHTAYMNGPFVPRGWWTMIFLYLGWLMVTTGLILWLRSIFVLGVDKLALVYVYHPSGGELTRSAIYGILRHPIYAGMLRLMIGLALLNGNGNALAFIFFAPLGFTGWIRLVEERELIERFGEEYLDYRKHVPAFWPKMMDIPGYLRFIFTGR